MFKTGHTSVNRFMVFWVIEGLWQLCIQQIYQCHFSNSVCSLRVSVSHPGNSLAPSNFLMLFYVLQWSVILDVTAATCWRIRWWVVFFSNKVFLIKACTFFRHNAITHLIYWETKKFTWLAFCDLCFIGVVWKWTRSASEVGLCASIWTIKLPHLAPYHPSSCAQSPAKPWPLACPSFFPASLP